MVTKKGSNTGSSFEGTSGNFRTLTVSFNEITDSGAYYEHSTGRLIRIPGESIAPGHSPLMNFVSNDEDLVTRISSDPWVPVNKARQICSNMDLAINF